MRMASRATWFLFVWLAVSGARGDFAAVTVEEKLTKGPWTQYVSYLMPLRSLAVSPDGKTVWIVPAYPYTDKKRANLGAGILPHARKSVALVNGDGVEENIEGRKGDYHDLDHDARCKVCQEEQKRDRFLL